MTCYLNVSILDTSARHKNQERLITVSIDSTKRGSFSIEISCDYFGEVFTQEYKYKWLDAAWNKNIDEDLKDTITKCLLERFDNGFHFNIANPNNYSKPKKLKCWGFGYDGKLSLLCLKGKYSGIIPKYIKDLEDKVTMDNLNDYPKVKEFLEKNNLFYEI